MIGFKYSRVTDGKADGSQFTEGSNEVEMGLTGDNVEILLNNI